MQLTDLEVIELENRFRGAARDSGSWFTAERSNQAAEAIAELLARREREKTDDPAAREAEQNRRYMEELGRKA